MPTLTIAADYANLSHVRDLVEAEAARLGLAESTIYDIKLAIDEAVTNIILHGYHDGPGEIIVSAELVDNALVMTLTDNAAPYDPTGRNSPDLSVPLTERKLGGMGVFLMQQTMDVLHHEVTPQGGNRLTMIKRKQA